MEYKNFLAESVETWKEQQLQWRRHGAATRQCGSLNP